MTTNTSAATLLGQKFGQLAVNSKSAAPLPKTVGQPPVPLQAGTARGGPPPAAISSVASSKPLTSNYTGLQWHQNTDPTARSDFESLPAGPVPGMLPPSLNGNVLYHANGPHPEDRGTSLLPVANGTMRGDETTLTRGKPTPLAPAAQSKPIESPRPFNPSEVRPSVTPTSVGTYKASGAKQPGGNRSKAGNSSRPNCETVKLSDASCNRSKLSCAEGNSSRPNCETVKLSDASCNRSKAGNSSRPNCVTPGNYSSDKSQGQYHNFLPLLLTKTALTFPPIPRQAPPTGFLQRGPYSPTPYGQMPNNMAPNPGAAQQNQAKPAVSAGRGRPAGSTGAAPMNNANVTPQPSIVNDVSPSTSATSGKGFGNDGASSSTGTSKGTSSTGGAKMAGILTKLGLGGTNAMRCDKGATKSATMPLGSNVGFGRPTASPMPLNPPTMPSPAMPTKAMGSVGSGTVGKTPGNVGSLEMKKGSTQSSKKVVMKGAKTTSVSSKCPYMTSDTDTSKSPRKAQIGEKMSSSNDATLFGKRFGEISAVKAAGGPPPDYRKVHVSNDAGGIDDVWVNDRGLVWTPPVGGAGRNLSPNANANYYPAGYKPSPTTPRPAYYGKLPPTPADVVTTKTHNTASMPVGQAVRSDNSVVDTGLSGMRSAPAGPPKMPPAGGIAPGISKESVHVNSKSAHSKQALLGSGVAAGLGALLAPQEHKWEGANRGVGRWAGLSAGMGVGAAGGGGLGLGLGGALGALAGNPVAGAGLGGLVGASTGALVGGVKGYQRAGKYMGEASYDKEKPKKKKEDKEEKKRTKKADPVSLGVGLADNALQGGALNNARGYSEGATDEERSKLKRHGALQGVGTYAGSGIGAILGALAGGGLGLGVNALTDKPNPYTQGNSFNDESALSKMIAPVAGASIGGAVGGYHGGKLLFNALEPKHKEHKKHEGHPG